MARLNCWQVMKCGREPGGARVAELSVCPAAEETRLDGINRGENGGRACWGVPGTDCARILFGGRKFSQCLDCEFFQRVEREEGGRFEVMRKILERLHNPGPSS